MKRHQGFTLLEMLVAISIFALMYVLAQQFFSQMMDTRDALNTKAEALEKRQQALLLITQDFEQFIARPVRDSLGDTQPAIKGGKTGIEFTHLGWANPFSLQHRSRMQRVRYVLFEGQLIRRYWPVLDANVGSRPVDHVVLDKVESISFRYLGQDTATDQWVWFEQWPNNQNILLPALLQPPPRSVELTVEFEGGEELHRYFRLVTNPWANE